MIKKFLPFGKKKNIEREIGAQFCQDPYGDVDC